MKNKLKSTLITFLTLTQLNATTIKSTGYGDLENEAKKEALSSLSNKISVDVKSDFKTITKSFGDEYKKDKEKLIHLSSNLPLKGIEFETIVGDRLVKTTAILSSTKALKLYEVELERLNKNISNSMKEYKTTKNNDIRYNILHQVLNDIKNFNKHKTVAILLEGKNLPTLSITQSQIYSKLQKLSQNITTLKIATKVLTKDIKQSAIYISAIKPSGSSQVTQFAKILKDSMSKELSIVKYSSKAKYFLRGSYEILKNSMFVTINLSDINNNILKTTTTTLNPSAYQHTKYKPSTKTFDEALNKGFVKSGKLNVQIGFKGFNRTDGIDLTNGDMVDIVVKTNKPMCYFLLGHTLKDDNKFSYVLPIGSDNSPFINSITGEDVNKNITIVDEVPISEPFGSENLQIFASTFNKNGSCPLTPPHCEENEDGYCVVGGTPSLVVAKTRGLNIKKKKFKIEKSEASVSFTSF
ncbi:MAG: hypothetical protein U9R37_08480 [Campylobacterota bacterium]|nr:hypothetical protein [Campylobacterota bacterium]